MKPQGVLSSVLGASIICAAIGAPVAAQTPEEVAEAALTAAPVWDGHNDVPWQLRVRYQNTIDEFDFVDTTDTGTDNRNPMHTDLLRLAKGKVGAQFWSVYVSTSLSEPQAVLATLEQIDVARRLIDQNSEDLEFALTADDVERARKSGKIASMLGMEGGHSIGSSLAVLRQMYDLGARYMTLTHSQNTPWADSATDAPSHNGLTDLGRDVVREMNRLGMLVDLSHVSEKVMHDALDTTAAPVIFSHSSARAINGHVRNVPDSVLKRLPDNGGIIMVTFVPGFLSEPARQWNANRRAEQARLEALWQGQPDAVTNGMKVWDEANPLPQSSIAETADHIDHVRKVAGVASIGIGGDYDGIPFAPPGLEDVSGYPALFTELARRGYTQDELEAIAFGNMMRVMRAAEAVKKAQSDRAPIENPAQSFD